MLTQIGPHMKTAQYAPYLLLAVQLNRHPGTTSFLVFNPSSLARSIHSLRNA